MMQAEALDSPLQLEHLIGFSANKDECVQFHPVDNNVLISYSGTIILISSTDDPHLQHFLRGHDEEITCLAISPSGTLIASGQLSATRVHHSEAMVLVWDYATRQRVYALSHLSDGSDFSRNAVRQLAFSSDDRYLAGSDDAGRLAVWDLPTGTLTTTVKQPSSLDFLTWGAIVASDRKMGPRAKYYFFSGSNSRVNCHTLEFDVHTMQYRVHTERMQFPSSGLSRTYLCGEMQGDDAAYLVCGTSAGELAIFNAATHVFRACVPVSCGGMLAIDTLETAEGCVVYCGCGDGKVKALLGKDMEWRVVAEAALGGGGKVRSLNHDASGTRLLATTSTGEVYVMDAMTLAPAAGLPVPMISAHCAPLHCVAFGESSEVAAVAAANGTIRLWELSHYTVAAEIRVPNELRPHVLVYTGGLILSGWSDGSLRCFDDRSRLEWEIPKAHRGALSAIAVSPRFILSGGDDGALRLWSPSTRAMLAQFSEHRSAIVSVLVDAIEPSLVHSCSRDKSIVTVDLKEERRVVTQKVVDGQFTAMAQSARGERELVSVDHMGVVKMWDCDVVGKPVHSFVTHTERDDEMGREKRVNHISISPATADADAGRFVAIAAAAGDLQIWELGDSSQPVSIGMAHSHEVAQAAWAPDGKQIVSVGLDHCVCVWNFFA